MVVVLSGGKKVATKAKRWYKEVGLGFKTPAEAINGTYIGQYTPSAHSTTTLSLLGARLRGCAVLMWAAARHGRRS